MSRFFLQDLNTLSTCLLSLVVLATSVATLATTPRFAPLPSAFATTLVTIGHESNGCPLPRSTEAKQCYHCQGLGHVQADCPTLRLSGTATGGRCYNCGQPGHLARACPNPGNPGMGRGAPMGRGGFVGGYGRGGFANGPRPATCYKCGGPNHFARDCQAQAMKCYACGKLGHISRDCTAPNGGPLNTAGKTCYQCGEAGHISRDCPQKTANTEINNEVVDLNNVPAPSVAPIAPVA
ncbi:uncharacterized protein TrAtP1_008974 [Trichoderma atroviride]|uniref:uncharacterized protein n=1 Tax=Hypocrea atroviridis TaxID=63577 RepID=UPI00331F0A11|nr:hypothetical protein TrAtP1_008974 [Trichoderma atroviride]